MRVLEWLGNAKREASAVVAGGEARLAAQKMRESRGDKTSARGDTLIEVVFAFAIFSAVVTGAILVLNAGIARAEGALELSLARTEIDAQAEALRFVHNAYAKNPVDNDVSYYQLWQAIVARATDDAVGVFPEFKPESCRTLYENVTPAIFSARAFVLNARKISPGNADSLVVAEYGVGTPFTEATIYPRIIYGASGTSETSDTEMAETVQFDTVAGVEGIYVLAAQEKTFDVPEFYDFYIYTCWQAPGSDVPTTIGTTLRLYNPELE